MMKLVMAFYNESLEALNSGASINDILKMAVRERIGRYKYTLEADVDKEYETIHKELAVEIANICGKEDQ